MSKSLKRVTDALTAAGLNITPVEMADGTRTAADAAAAVGCAIDQIAKSIVLQGLTSGRIVVFVTPGGRQVDLDRAAVLAKEALGRADAAAVRAQTGFAIGGVSPVGHVTQIATFFDRGLTAFDTVWAAAGTPRHVFAIAPDDLARISGAVVADFTA